MDSSKIYGDHRAEEEECQSSESGWTMYLGSHSDSENDHQRQHVKDDDQHDGKSQGYYNKDDNDDSMVSDASSGPSTHQRSRSVYADGNKQEEKGKAKKQSASLGTEKKVKTISSKAK